MTFALSGRRHLQCGTQYTFMKPTSCLVCQNDTLDEAYASSMWVKITLHQEKVALPGHFPGTIDSLSMAMSLERSSLLCQRTRPVIDVSF